MGPRGEESIGPYRLLRPLGRGAMAEVYLAERVSLGGFRHKVALKVVLPQFARDEAFLNLLSREAIIGSRLRHPNIVETLEFSAFDGLHFLVLEYVDGKTLEQMLLDAEGAGRQALPTRVALEATAGVLHGLTYAHALKSDDGEPMGIVHRDLKPGNVMVSRHGAVKIMDFGIARAKGPTQRITRDGQVRGTPVYMAPEQVTGRPLDGRTDQYTVATVLYELLTGHKLFGARSVAMIMSRIAHGEIGEAPSALDQICPGLGPICEHMWAFDPADRYADCAEPAAAIEQLVATLTVESSGLVKRPPPVARRRKRRRRPHPTTLWGRAWDELLVLAGLRKPRRRKRRARRLPATPKVATPEALVVPMTASNPQIEESTSTVEAASPAEALVELNSEEVVETHRSRDPNPIMVEEEPTDVVEPHTPPLGIDDEEGTLIEPDDTEEVATIEERIEDTVDSPGPTVELV